MQERGKSGAQTRRVGAKLKEIMAVQVSHKASTSKGSTPTNQGSAYSSLLANYVSHLPVANKENWPPRADSGASSQMGALTSKYHQSLLYRKNSPIPVKVSTHKANHSIHDVTSPEQVSIGGHIQMLSHSNRKPPTLTSKGNLSNHSSMFQSPDEGSKNQLLTASRRGSHQRLGSSIGRSSGSALESHKASHSKHNSLCREVPNASVMSKPIESLGERQAQRRNEAISKTESIQKPEQLQSSFFSRKNSNMTTSSLMGGQTIYSEHSASKKLSSQLHTRSRSPLDTMVQNFKTALATGSSVHASSKKHLPVSGGVQASSTQSKAQPTSSTPRPVVVVTQGGQQSSVGQCHSGQGQQDCGGCHGGRGLMERGEKGERNERGKGEHGDRCGMGRGGQGEREGGQGDGLDRNGLEGGTGRGGEDGVGKDGGKKADGGKVIADRGDSRRRVKGIGGAGGWAASVGGLPGRISDVRSLIEKSNHSRSISRGTRLGGPDVQVPEKSSRTPAKDVPDQLKRGPGLTTSRPGFATKPVDKWSSQTSTSRDAHMRMPSRGDLKGLSTTGSTSSILKPHPRPPVNVAPKLSAGLSRVLTVLKPSHPDLPHYTHSHEQGFKQNGSPASNGVANSGGKSHNSGETTVTAAKDVHPRSNLSAALDTKSKYEAIFRPDFTFKFSDLGDNMTGRVDKNSPITSDVTCLNEPHVDGHLERSIFNSEPKVQNREPVNHNVLLPVTKRLGDTFDNDVDLQSEEQRITIDERFSNSAPRKHQEVLDWRGRGLSYTESLKTLSHKQFHDDTDVGASCLEDRRWLAEEPVHECINLDLMLGGDSVRVPSALFVRKFQHNGTHLISLQMRAVLLNWIAEVVESFMYKREVYHLAVNYLDRYLDELDLSVPKRDFQLLGLTCLYMASKVDVNFA